MRVLLDECLPRQLRRDLPGHEVQTVVQMGWSTITNGTLLGFAEEEFDVFITVDRNMEHQQNLRGIQLAIIVLFAPRNDYAHLQPLMPQVRDVLQTIQIGEVVHVQR